MDQDVAELDLHSRNSTLRERIIEHVFIGDVLRRLWQLGITDVEVLRSEFDAGGYDLVLAWGAIIRHIQFKSVTVDGKAARTSVSLKLAEKPSGCVIWMVVTPALLIDSYLWFGAAPGLPLPDLDAFAVSKHTKGNADGVKLERPNHRTVPRRRFERLKTLDEVLTRLFGPLVRSSDGLPLLASNRFA
jgi:hypothetical protein